MPWLTASLSLCTEQRQFAGAGLAALLLLFAPAADHVPALTILSAK